MTELEQSVSDALRLSERAAKRLEKTIQKNIRVARLELIRAGVPASLANSDFPLVEDAIVTFCLYKMDKEENQAKHLSAFEYQEDSLRKSTIGIGLAIKEGSSDGK